MLHPQCFTREWLQRQAEAIGSRNLVMMEKAIVALQLLGHLAESGFPANNGKSFCSSPDKFIPLTPGLTPSHHSLTHKLFNS